MQLLTQFDHWYKILITTPQLAEFVKLKNNDISKYNNEVKYFEDIDLIMTKESTRVIN